MFADRQVALTFSKLDGQHLLGAWIPLLALAAARPDLDSGAVCIGRARGGGLAKRVLRSPREDPTTILGELVALYDAGRRQPILLPIKTSYAWAAARFELEGGNYNRRRPPDPQREARSKWRYEREDAAVERIWGKEPDLSVLLTPALPGRRSTASRHGWVPTPRGCGGPYCAPRGRGADGTFRPVRPLPAPASTTVLEASAGTGKTFTLAGLVTRYVAEGRASLDQMLLITFSRSATQELRERVRDALQVAVRAIENPETVGTNALLQHLVDVDAAELDARRERLMDALAGFDAATIATTHQFCNVVLKSLGVAGDTDAGVQLVENLEDLVAEIVDDLYLKLFGNLTDRPKISREDALSMARAIADQGGTDLRPAKPTFR